MKHIQSAIYHSTPHSRRLAQTVVFVWREREKITRSMVAPSETWDSEWMRRLSSGSSCEDGGSQRWMGMRQRRHCMRPREEERKKQNQIEKRATAAQHNTLGFG